MLVSVFMLGNHSPQVLEPFQRVWALEKKIMLFCGNTPLLNYIYAENNGFFIAFHSICPCPVELSYEKF